MHLRRRVSRARPGDPVMSMALATGFVVGQAREEELYVRKGDVDSPEDKRHEAWQDQLLDDPSARPVSGYL